MYFEISARFRGCQVEVESSQIVYTGGCRYVLYTMRHKLNKLSDSVPDAPFISYLLLLFWFKII